MKKIIIITIALIMLISCREKKEIIKNHSFIEDKLELLGTSDKILVLEFWSPSCSPCIRLKKDIFENHQNQDFLADNFVLVQISSEDSIYKSLFSFYGLKFQSSVLFFNSKGVEIERSVGYNGNKDSYMKFLQDINKGKNLYSEICKKYLKDTSDIHMNYLMAKKLLFRYENEKAIQHIKFVLKKDVNNEYGYLYESAFRIAEYEYNQSGEIEKLKSFVKSYPKNNFMPQAYIYLVNYYKKMNEHKNCVLTSSEALCKFPFNAELLNKHAWNIYLFKIEEDYADALEMIQMAIEMNPLSANYWDTQAWLYFETGKIANAIQSEKKAIDIFPHGAYKKALETFESI